jgi:hypothetical protein
MSNIPQLPTRAEFIRDRLADTLDAHGYTVEAAEPESEFELPTIAWSGPGTGGHVAVSDETARGRFFDADSPPGHGELRFHGFTWDAEPTDTGVMHGPKLPTTSDPFLETARRTLARQITIARRRSNLSHLPLFASQNRAEMDRLADTGLVHGPWDNSSVATSGVVCPFYLAHCAHVDQHPERFATELTACAPRHRQTDVRLGWCHVCNRDITAVSDHASSCPVSDRGPDHPEIAPRPRKVGRTI